jgi:hypothetical protein
MNPSFFDYPMSTINMMPRIETTLVHGNPGAGETACVPPLGGDRQYNLQRCLGTD